MNTIINGLLLMFAPGKAWQAIADDAPRTDNVGDDINPKVVREGLDHDFAS